MYKLNVLQKNKTYNKLFHALYLNFYIKNCHTSLDITDGKTYLGGVANGPLDITFNKDGSLSFNVSD